ncbi:L-hydantoinase [bioreactor metagenome]|uniref:L-hydantoinase n=1 Tax=bioreactor metagenome TaxID=1076179 RepID=A0A645B220_9ZZZZ
MVGTDHAPHSHEEKFNKSWWDTLPGTIGVQTSLALMLDRVNKGQTTLNRVVQSMSTRPAQVFGLHPRKGCLELGADADITIVDMDKRWTVTHEEMHSKTKFTPFNGFELQGKPVMTIVMGQVVMADGEIVGRPGIAKMVNPKKEW